MKTTAPRRTQQQRSAESAERLRQALAELVIEQGYERTTAAEIGLRAGYSRAMVRERYESKDQLLGALHRDYEALLLGRNDEESGLARILGAFDRLHQFSLEKPILLKAILIASFEAAAGGHVMRPVVDRWLAALGAQLQQWIREGLDDGTVSAGIDVEAEVEQLLIEAIGISYRWIQDPDLDSMPRRLTAWRDRSIGRLRRS
ncbi:TetR/AcrR family transcriptional regulator [Antrihabitans spumae]|jgi:AcrR family transcriptional regulator|uniref:TetR/AcrR family transcriptional regulator n=1 Tax=Antrihabitans spumae TaxID=3373370 RepID=A0ABW7KLS5_9NOCA